jgi:hypothetical protein
LHFHTAIANDQEWKDGLANEQLSMSVDPTVDISVPEADKDSESVSEFVQNEMHSFSFRSRTFRASTMYNV